MGFGSNDDNDNDLPDWLRGIESEDDNGGVDPDEGVPSDGDDLPDWLEDSGEDVFSTPDDSEADGELPEWLANIRKEEDSQQEPSFSSEEGDEDEEDWLSSPQEEDPQAQAEPAEEEGEEDLISAAWGEEEQDAEEGGIAAQWEVDTGGLPEEFEDEGEEGVPDWVSGLPAIEVTDERAEESFERPESGQQEDEDEVPDWLSEIRQKTTDETRPPEDVLPEFGLKPEDMYTESGDEEIEDAAEEEPEDVPAGPAFEEEPPDTGEVPTWLKNLQASERPPEAYEEESQEAPVYSEEDVSSLFEGDDLPDWLGEEVEAIEEEPEEEPDQEVEQLDEELEKAELPSWLQAMRPVEAVTSDTEAGEEEDRGLQEAETVGPLSGLSDVLPAEPHIVHFGTKPKPYQKFDLSEPQKNYARLLKSLVEKEAVFTPAKRRSVTNPQQILRWAIAIVMLAILFAVVWLNGDFMPLPTGDYPEENLAVVSIVDELEAGERVLLAFEYQPGFSGEMQAASAALIEHLLLREAQLVVVSTQPVGPGLAETFLQQRFQDSAYITGRAYANFGYISGGTAGLLNFALNPRQAKPEMAWNTAPLDAVQTVSNFSMVVVVTDDPDIARSWIEQVGPLLAVGDGGAGIPLVMVTSAQAEPLVYPYYLNEPKQVSGIISGVGGGAYYETKISPAVARRYWDAYNTGLVLAVLVVALGSMINLARTSLDGQPKGRSQ